MTARPGVVVFDLDGTLIRDDSFSRFLTMLLLRRPLGGAAALPIAGPLFAIPATRKPAVNVWLWFATVGMPEEKYTRLARRFARSHAGERAGRAIQAAISRLKEHQAEGHRIVVVTGSEERLAREICAVLGLTGVDVVGSTLVRRRGALAADVHCYGPRKLVRLEEAGHRAPFVCAYTDSSADLPLLLAAAGRFMVEPKPRHLKRILAAAADCLTLE